MVTEQSQQKQREEEAWKKILKNVQTLIPSQQFRAWVEPVQLLAISDGKLQLVTPTQFNKDWLLDHLQNDIERLAHAELNEPHQLYITVQNTSKSPIDDSAKTITTAHSAVSTTKDVSSSVDAIALAQSLSSISSTESNLSLPTHSQENNLASASNKSIPFHRETQTNVNQHFPKNSGTNTISLVRTIGENLDTKHTFENFVVGASNQFAHAACRAVADNPASQYNPLFLYSGAGLGKTHLLHAIGNAFLVHNPKAKICYLSAETFANELIECLRNQKMPQFRQKYRDSFDILLMDDFQFIAGKDRTQEEFFHTFNALHTSKKQIVVTSDQSPKDIPGLEERIRTRFECGLIADIQPPEIETRIAILKSKAERDDVFLPDNVALFLASNIKSNIRELEGALIRLEAQASLNGVEISYELAKRELATIIKEPTYTVSADTILSLVARHFELKVADLKSRDRSRKFSQPRQIAMYLLRKYTDKSLPEIGLLLGGKDHSTVLHGVNTVSKSIDRDLLLSKHVSEIQNSL